MDFLAFAASQRVREDNQLMKLHKLIDWTRIEKMLGRLSRSGRGPKGYSILGLVKAMILQQWHSLSDPGLEEALRVRLDFMLFTGFSSGDVPDETTLCRFRAELVEQKIDQPLLQESNAQLERWGLKVKHSAGAIVDATVVASAARPRKEIIVQPGSKREDSEQEEQIVERSSHDPQARWLCKAKRLYYGYRNYVTIDSEHGYVEKVLVAPANASEMHHFPLMTDSLQAGRWVFADKGFASKDNRQWLTSQQLRDGVMNKATRDKPLSVEQKKHNRWISTYRYKVEQAFGTLKRRFHMKRSSYIGLEKTQWQCTWKAICFNLLKAVRRMQRSPVHS